MKPTRYYATLRRLDSSREDNISTFRLLFPAAHLSKPKEEECLAENLHRDSC